MVNRSSNDTYKDIIRLPHFVSKKRPQMDVKNRAAQFSPFAAVVGHETAVKEAARLTDDKRELDETQKSVINSELRDIEMYLPNLMKVEIEYFEEDLSKKGGKYISITGCIKKIDVFLSHLEMNDGIIIPIEMIYKIRKE